MRWKLSGSVAVAAAILIALSGCLHVVSPPHQTDDERALAHEAAQASAYEAVLARSWAATDISEAMVRPDLAVGPALPEAEWIDAFFDCMANAGYLAVGLSYGAGLPYELILDEPEQTDSAIELAFFACLAAHSQSLPIQSAPLTRAQLDYIYDYYQEMTIPCLEHHGYTPHLSLTRERFVTLEGAWSPYRQIWNETNPHVATSELVPLCGPETPALD